MMQLDSQVYFEDSLPRHAVNIPQHQMHFSQQNYQLYELFVTAQIPSRDFSIKWFFS